MYGYIYLTENNINETVYIGQHKSNKKDENYLGSGKLITKAIRKYGKENFTNIIIDKAESLEELNTKEIFWIDFYKNRLKRRVYNLTIGGDGVVGSIMSEESKRKISIAQTGEKNYNYGKPKSKEFKEIASKTHKGKKVTEETRNKLRQYSGSKNSRYGVKLSEEIKRKISESNKGRIFTEEHRKKLSEKKKGTTSWTKGKNMKEIMPEHYEKLRKMATGRPSPNRKKVVVLTKEREILKRFDSIAECAKYFDTHISCIQKVLSGKRKTYKKMIIEFDN